MAAAAVAVAASAAAAEPARPLSSAARGHRNSVQPPPRRSSVRPRLSKPTAERPVVTLEESKAFRIDEQTIAYLENALAEFPRPKTAAGATMSALVNIITRPPVASGEIGDDLTPSERYVWGKIVADEIAQDRRQLAAEHAKKAAAAAGSAHEGDKSGSVGGEPLPALRRGSRASMASATDLSKRFRDTGPELPGLLVRDFLSAMYKSTRDRMVWNACVFAAFVSVFLVTIGLLYSVGDAFNTNSALRNLYLDQEFAGSTYKKNFYEVATHQEMWQWLEGPFFEGTFPATHYNGEPLNATEEGYALNYLRVLGSIQIRQIRVRNDSCELSFAGPCDAVQGSPSAECVGPLDTLDHTCFGVYSEENEERRPFVGAHSGRVYEWSDGMPPIDMRLTRSGFLGHYGTGGYVVELPSWNRTEAESILADLKSDLWTDRATRLLAVHINFYNTNSRLLSALRIVFEIYPGSFFLTSVRMNTVPINLYDERKDQFRLVLELVLLVGTLYFVIRLLLRISRLRKKLRFLLQLSTLLEIAFLTCVTATAVNWLIFVAAPGRRSFNVNETRYIEFYEMGSAYIEATTMAGVVGFLATLRVFQFFSVSRRMNVLWLTLWRAFGDLVWFSLAFFILVAAFAFVGEMTFGFFVYSFRTFSDAFGTLLRYPLGDFRYLDLSVARPEITGFFFTLYVAFVIFVGMNLIIAIISKYYEDVHVEVHVQDLWKKSTQSYESDVSARFIRFLRWVRARIARKIRGDPPKKAFFLDGAPLLSDEELTPSNEPEPCRCYWTWIGRALCLFERRRDPRTLSEDENGTQRTGQSTEDGFVDFSCVCCGRKKRNNRVTDQSWLVEAERATEEQEIALEYSRWEAQSRFQEAVAKCIRLARNNHGSDLFTYIDAMYTESGKNNLLFITAEELTELISDQSVSTSERRCARCGWCESLGDEGDAGGDEEDGRRRVRRTSSIGAAAIPVRAVSDEVEEMIGWYNKMKAFIFLWDPDVHQSVPLEVKLNDMIRYDVEKRDRMDRILDRVLFLDIRRGVLLNCKHETKLTRRFPLTELVWMDYNRSRSPREVNLLFTSKNVTVDEHHLIGPKGLDTILRLEFASEHIAEQFMNDVSRARASILAEIQSRIRRIAVELSVESRSIQPSRHASPANSPHATAGTLPFASDGVPTPSPMTAPAASSRDRRVAMAGRPRSGRNSMATFSSRALPLGGADASRPVGPLLRPMQEQRGLSERSSFEPQHRGRGRAAGPSDAFDQLSRAGDATAHTPHADTEDVPVVVESSESESHGENGSTDEGGEEDLSPRMQRFPGAELV